MMDFCFLIYPTFVAEGGRNPETLTCVDKTSPNKSMLSPVKGQGMRKPSKMENSQTIIILLQPNIIEKNGDPTHKIVSKGQGVRLLSSLGSNKVSSLSTLTGWFQKRPDMDFHLLWMVRHHFLHFLLLVWCQRPGRQSRFLPWTNNYEPASST